MQNLNTRHGMAVWIVARRKVIREALKRENPYMDHRLIMNLMRRFHKDAIRVRQPMLAHEKIRNKQG